MAAKGGGGTDGFGPSGGGKGRPSGAGKHGGRIGDTDSGRQLLDLLKSMQPEPKPGPSSHPKANGGEKEVNRRECPDAASQQPYERPRGAKAKKRRPTAMQQKRSRTPQAKPKEMVRISAEQKAAAIAQADKASGFRPDDVYTSTQSTSPKVTDFGAGAFQRIKALRPALEGFAADAQAPSSVDDDTYRQTIGRIELGAASLDTIVAEAEGYIGCDFGTSTTKTVVRWPYEAGSGYAIALPVPKAWRSGGVPHLWPTTVYFDPDTKRFSPLPRPGFRCITGFKSALLDGNPLRMCASGLMTNADAAVAFLAQYLAYAVGTVRERFPDKKISMVNFGVPVAKLLDCAVANDFKRVIKAAIGLIGRSANLTLADVRMALAEPQDCPILASFHAELSGAIAGYCSSARHRHGPHMIIDCGSATLDIASFDLGEGEWPIGIYAAQVEPLGADACARYLAMGANERDCRDAARYQEAEVCGRTLRKERTGFQLQPDGKFNYQVILVGGGIDSAIHSALLKRMEEAFSFKFHRPRFDRPVKKSSDADDARLILASGLARDPFDLRSVAMPDDRPGDDWGGPDMITKGQV
jgi:hypothetical protein